MRQRHTWHVGLTAAILLFLPNLAHSAINPVVSLKLAALAVPFVPNAGQWDDRIAFAAHTFAGVLFVTTDGQFVYRLPGKELASADASSPSTSPAAVPQARKTGLPRRPTGPGWVLTETLVDANGQALPGTPSGYRPQAGKVSYAIGNDESKHKNGLPSYERVRLGAVYPGIDVQLRATGKNVEKIFTVAPHVDPAAIHIRLDGAQQLEIGNQGELIAHTGNGPVTYTEPIAYQEDARGHRSPVPVRYALDTTPRRYGFAVGDYDRSRALVIDPLLQSTYLGGSGGDWGSALAIHPATGEVYVAGNTRSTDFPKVTGAEQTTRAGDFSAFVTWLNATLTARLQSTYLGGMRTMTMELTTGQRRWNPASRRSPVVGAASHGCVVLTRCKKLKAGLVRTEEAAA